MDFMIRGRQAGKTYELIQWVLQGTKINAYPGWSRVLIVPDMAQLMWVKGKWQAEVADFHHRVFFWEEWQKAYIGRDARQQLEIAVDNVDILLRGFGVGNIVRVTATGELI